MRENWNKYIQHAIDDDMGENMQEVYFNERSNFFCVVDEREGSATKGSLIGIVPLR